MDPFPLDRSEGGCRVVVVNTAEAIASFTGGEAFPAPAVGCRVR